MKALEELSSLSDHKDRAVAIYTDSRVTLASLTNNFIHSPLIAGIRKKVRQLMTQNWSIYFGWVRAYVGIEGNEVAHKIAKERGENDGELNIACNRIPIATFASELKKEGLKK